jgi:hypothetical protein
MNPDNNPLKKLAKTLLREVKAADSAACSRVRAVYVDTRELTDTQLAEHTTLMRAQHVMAVEHEFESWDEVAKANPVLVRLAITMRKEPWLNDYGMGVYDRRLNREQRKARLKEERAKLRASVDDVERTMAWLQENIPPIKTINHRHTSYGLKDITEREIGYITNGVFIAAALILGYKPKFRDSPNVEFAMSEKAIRRAFNRVHGY